MKLRPVVLIFLLFVSCNGDLAKRAVSTHPPNNSNEALSLLSKMDLSALTFWKSQLLKRCDARDVFFDPTNNEITGDTSTNSIDLSVMLEKTQNSLLVAYDDKDWALLGSPKLLHGSHSVVLKRDGVKGQNGYALDVQFIAQDSSCKVFVFGQQIWDLTLVESFPVYALSSSTSRNFKKTVSPINSSAQGFMDGIWDFLSPTSEKLEFLTVFFKLTSSERTKFFIPSSIPALLHSVEIENSADLAPFNQVKNQLLGSAAAIKSVTERSGLKKFKITAISPHLNLSGLENNADLPLFTISALVRSTVTAAPEGKREDEIDAVQWQGFKNFEPQNFLMCFNQRFFFLKTGNDVPLYSDTILPCEALSDDPTGELLKDSSSSQKIFSLVGQMNGEAAETYFGWDFLIQEWMVRNFGRSGMSGLPAGNSFLINQLSTNLSDLMDLLNTDSTLQSLQSELIRKVSQWTFKGILIDKKAIKAVLDALKNSLTIFRHSTLVLVSNLDDPFSEENKKALDFAMALNSKYKKTAFEILRIGFDSSSESAHYFQRRFDTILQSPVPLEVLNCWKNVILQSSHAMSDLSTVLSCNAEFK